MKWILMAIAEALGAFVLLMFMWIASPVMIGKRRFCAARARGKAFYLQLNNKDFNSFRAIATTSKVIKITNYPFLWLIKRVKQQTWN